MVNCPDGHTSEHSILYRYFPLKSRSDSVSNIPMHKLSKLYQKSLYLYEPRHLPISSHQIWFLNLTWKRKKTKLNQLLNLSYNNLSIFKGKQIVAKICQSKPINYVQKDRSLLKSIKSIIYIQIETKTIKINQYTFLVVIRKRVAS